MVIIFDLSFMKKTLVFCFAVCLIFLGIGCTPSSSQIEEKDAQGAYRKVTYDAALTFTFNPANVTSPGLLVCYANGRVRMQWWFEEDGGEAIAEQSEVTVTDYNCDAFGTAKPCPSDFVPNQDMVLAFTSFARLAPGEGSITTVNGVTTQRDELSFVIKQLPESRSLQTNQCGALMSDFSGSFSQVLLPFATEQRTIPVTFGETHFTSQEGLPAQMGYWLALDSTAIEEWVDELPQ
jgi:hypothetical protein